MPTTPDMSMDTTAVGDTGLLDTLQHEVAVPTELKSRVVEDV